MFRELCSFRAWRIWKKLWGFGYYKPPGASCTAQGPQKEPEKFKNLVFIFHKQNQQKKKSRMFPL